MWRIAARISLVAAMVCSLSCRSSSPPGKYGDYPSEVSVAYLKSLCKGSSTVIRNDLTVTGRVVATDKLSEFRGAVVVADAGGGIEISVDSERTDILMPLYSEVKIHCQMLALGDYGGKIILGAEPSSGYAVDRLSESDLPHFVEVLSTATSLPEAFPVEIGALSAADISRYVVLDDVRFVDGETGLAWCDFDPQTMRRVDTYRHIVDSAGDTLAVYTRGACAYASVMLPSGDCRIYGIVDCFNGGYSLTVSNYRVIEK